ncbi:MAG: acyltransferase family protein [Panacagrimonas sp.]
MLALGWLEMHRKGPGNLQAVLGSRIVRFASDTSYGVYLFHAFFISIAGLLIHANADLQSLPAPQRVLAMLAFVTISSYGTAYLVHLAIERPCIRAGKKIIDRFVPGEPTSVRGKSVTGEGDEAAARARS